jgi:hypothetical protein
VDECEVNRERERSDPSEGVETARLDGDRIGMATMRDAIVDALRAAVGTFRFPRREIHMDDDRMGARRRRSKRYVCV